MAGIILRVSVLLSVVALVACNSLPQISIDSSQAKLASTEAPTTTPTRVEPPTPTPQPTAIPTSTPASPPPTATPKSVQITPAANSSASGPTAPLIVRGDTRKPWVSLTFDSGSDAGSTAEVLNILRENGIHTTFFVTGKWAEANPALVKRMVAEGHKIANHSYSHPDLTKVSDDEIISQLSRTEDIVKRIAGVSTKPYFRPPFGAYDNRVLRVLAREGYKAIYWTLDSTDWRNDSTVDSVIRRVVNNAEPGSIIVHHSSPDKTAKALPSEIKQLRAKGLQIVNLPDLLGE